MSKFTPFTIALYSGFVILITAAIIIVATFSGGGSGPGNVAQYGPRVTVWGSFDGEVVNNLFREYANENDAFEVVEYVEIDERTFDSDLINAIANGQSPDIIFTPDHRLVTHRNKFFTSSEASQKFLIYDELGFEQTYVEGAEIFLLSDGLYAVPLVVDPLVMYWNQDLFTEAGLVRPPRTWTELVNSTVPTITQTDTRRNLLRSAVALGEYQNLSNAQLILLALLQQAGSDLVYERVSSDERTYVIGLNTVNESGTTEKPLFSVVQFFTNFANPANQLYSWNRVQPQDLNTFTAGDLALYFGRGSEYTDVIRRNPNLNFSVTLLPQGGADTVRRTSGVFYGAAVLRQAPNPSGARSVLYDVFATAEFSARLSEALDMASVHDRVVEAGSPNAEQQINLQSAVIARGWLSPGKAATDEVLQLMIEDVTSSRVRIDQAVRDAINRLSLLY